MSRPDHSPEPTEVNQEATERYLEMIRAVHQEWDALDAAQDSSVRPSRRVMDSVMEAVRASSRHGPAISVPPTEHGPWTVTRLSLRTLVRQAVDSVPGALALRSTFEHAPAQADGQLGELGEPVRVRCHISAHSSVTDLPALADSVRQAVLAACAEHLGLHPDVDIHIEDLHDDEL